MEQQKENENSVAVRLKRHLGKMSAQVDYLIRNNKLLTQLDIDNLMTNTRELYDMLCSVNANMDVCSIPFEIENDSEEESVGRESEESRESGESEESNDEVENVDVEKEELPTESFELNIEEDENEDVNEDENENEDVNEEVNENDENEEEDLIDEENEDEDEEDEFSDVEDLSDLTEEDVEIFINELFRGNEERFSRAMAELEEAPTWKAALTHLEEMSIAYGWDYDSPAYQKLVELLERRY